VRSTASLDKNPQSQERGITLDLGFSCFIVKASAQCFQYTLVDCPGHASLIKTIIQGASIIDYMMLVIDVNKVFLFILGNLDLNGRVFGHCRTIGQ
jgi:selenocysteine-specific elongation factor